MSNTHRTLRYLVLLGLIGLQSACIVAEPREGFYDHDHHRYYREHAWHQCVEHDDYCR